MEKKSGPETVGDFLVLSTSFWGQCETKEILLQDGRSQTSDSQTISPFSFRLIYWESLFASHSLSRPTVNWQICAKEKYVDRLFIETHNNFCCFSKLNIWEILPIYKLKICICIHWDIFFCPKSRQLLFIADFGIYSSGLVLGVY